MWMPSQYKVYLGECGSDLFEMIMYNLKYKFHCCMLHAVHVYTTCEVYIDDDDVCLRKLMR